MGRLDFGPVPKETFCFVVEWLETVWATEPRHPVFGQEAMGGKLGALKDWLLELRDGDWPTVPGEYRTFICEPKESRRYATLGTYARKCLAAASQTLGFKYCKQTMKEKERFRVAWGDVSTLPAIPAKSHVVWLRLQYYSSFSDLLFLGAQSVAKRRGAALTLYELASNADFVSESARIVSEIEGTNGTEAHNTTAFVLELAHSTSSYVAKRECLAKYRVVTSGSRGATVCQNDHAIGTQLAQAAMASQGLARKAKIAVCASRGALDQGGNQDRIMSFRAAIEGEAAKRTATKIEVDEIALDYGPYRHPHELCEKLLSKRDTPGKFAYDLVFTNSGDIAEWLVPVLHTWPEAKRPRVVSADITPALVNLICEPDSPLEAVCGVDPFFYGEMIAEAAINPDLQGPFVAEPIYLTQKQVNNGGPGSYAQLVSGAIRQLSQM